MAEPILGQALALQSEFRPDTTQVLTKAVDKIGNATLKKQIAEAKAAEAKAKRQQEIAGMVKLDGVKVNTHYAQDVKDIVSDSYAKMIEASQRGDGIAINQLKTQAELELKNKVQQSEDQNKFLESEKQGFIVPQQIKIAFGMPRAEGQKYLKALLEQNPEYAAIVDMNQYGDYSYNTIKNIELETEFTRILDMNDNLYSPTGKKVIDEKSKDQLEIYKISDDNIRQFAKIKSTDPEFRANIFLKNKQDLQPIAASILAADKTLTPQQASEMAVEGYIYKQLSDRNQKTVKSNIPQKGGGFDIDFGGAGELTFDENNAPQGGSIPVRFTGKGTNNQQIDFDGQVPTGNTYGFKMATIGGTASEGVVDAKTNKPLSGKTFQKVETFEVTAVPIATKNFITSRGIQYYKGQMIDKGSVAVAVKQGLASFEPMVKGIATYKEAGVKGGKNIEETITSDVLIPAKNISTAVVRSQSKEDSPSTKAYIQRAIDEAAKLNKKYRSEIKGQSTTQPKTTGKPATNTPPKVKNKRGV
jgi:hypothetical protein